MISGNVRYSPENATGEAIVLVLVSRNRNDLALRTVRDKSNLHHHLLIPFLFALFFFLPFSLIAESKSRNEMPNCSLISCSNSDGNPQFLVPIRVSFR